MVKVFDPSLLDYVRCGSWLSSPTSWSSSFWVSLNQALAKSSDLEQQEIILLSCDCIIARINTYNILWNILFHSGKQICSPFFWFVCFALERRDLALAESVTLRQGPYNLYEGDFSYAYFQMQIEPYSSDFCLLGNSYSIKLVHTITLNGLIFQGYFLPVPIRWEFQTWNHTRPWKLRNYFDQGLWSWCPWTLVCFVSLILKLKILIMALFLLATLMVMEVLLKMKTTCDDPEIRSSVMCQAVIFLISHHRAT